MKISSNFRLIRLNDDISTNNNPMFSGKGKVWIALCKNVHVLSHVYKPVIEVENLTNDAERCIIYSEVSPVILLSLCLFMYFQRCILNIFSFALTL